MELSKLKEYIKTRLETLTSIGVYDGVASDGATFPYLVFKFTSSARLERNRSDWILEIDYWNDSLDDSSILSASENVKTGLDYGWQSENEGFFSSYLDFEGQIEDTEQDISRFNQRYVLKVY